MKKTAHRFEHMVDRLNGCVIAFGRAAALSSSRSFSPFRCCGYAGFSWAMLTVTTLAISCGLSLPVLTGLVVTALFSFFGLALAVRMMTGEERYTNYHHLLVFLGVVTLLLKATHQPLLPYLDLSVVGFGVFTAFGRIGCLLAGCCHGRPSRWGVTYGEAHAAAGFPAHFTDVCLFPVQLLEAGWVFGVSLTGAGLVLRHGHAGAALSFYLIAYALGRFHFEFLRGDVERPFLLGFSEAQWTSMILVWTTVGAEQADLLVLQPWHSLAAIALPFTMLAVAGLRRLDKTQKYKLIHPRHVKEVAEAVMEASLVIRTSAMGQGQAPLSRAAVYVTSTSLRIQITVNEIENSSGAIQHFAFSSPDSAMTIEAAEILAKLVLRLKHIEQVGQFVRGNQNVFHLLVQPNRIGKGSASIGARPQAKTRSKSQRVPFLVSRARSAQEASL